MDPKKDFIHIDEVFKKLSDGEEQERSGAWLHMKDLLDTQMPIGNVVSAGKSFRRYIIPLLALLLVGSGTATYYSLSKRNNEQDKRGSLANNTYNKESKPTVPATAGDKAQHSIVYSPSTAPNRENKAWATSRKGIVPTTNQQTSKPNLSASSPKDRRIVANKATFVLESKQQNSNAQKQIKHSSTQPLTPRENGNGRNYAKATTGKNVIEEQNILEEVNPGSARSESKTTKTNRAGQPQSVVFESKKSLASNRHKSITTQSGKKIVQTPDGNMYREERDTFKRIDILEHYASAKKAGKNQPVKLRMDTIAVTRIEKVRYIPLTKVELMDIQKMQLMNAATPLIPLTNLKEKTLSKEWVTLVPLTKYKVSSKKVDPSKFNDLIKNTTSGITNYFDGSHRFYAAILLGGNTTLGNPGAMGIQMGIAGLYSLSERLALAAELKFANHYLSNYSIEDHFL